MLQGRYMDASPSRHEDYLRPALIGAPATTKNAVELPSNGGSVAHKLVPVSH